MTLSRIFAAALLAITTAASAESLLPQKPRADALLPVDQAFVLQGATRKGQEIVVSWAIDPGYYLYRHAMKVTVDGPANVAFTGLRLPKGLAMKDPEFGDIEIYRRTLQARLTLPADGLAPRTLRVRYQGCADIGVCYPPQTRLVAVK